MPFSDDVRACLDADAAQIIAKYPRPRSALLPVFHLVQLRLPALCQGVSGVCRQPLVYRLVRLRQTPTAAHELSSRPICPC